MYFNIVFLFALIFSSVLNAAEFNSVKDNIEVVVFPTIGEQNSVFVGDEILSVSSISTSEDLFLPEDVVVYKAFGSPIAIFSKGTYVPLSQSVGEGSGVIYTASSSFASGRYLFSGKVMVGTNIWLSTDLTKFCASDYGAEGHKVRVFDSGFSKSCADDFKVKILKRKYVSEGTIRKVLIYNGRSGDKIRVGYREFTDKDLARPAFSNDIEYDLKDTKFISYKGARVEVIKATGEDLLFKVIKSF